MALPVQSCFNVLTLRQGTLLIAVVELFLSVFLLFLLLLGSADAQEMAAVLEADIEDSAAREGIALAPDTDLPSSYSSSSSSSVAISHNQAQLHKAQHLAFVVIMSLYTGVIMAIVHLISCILLLYGTAMVIFAFYVWLVVYSHYKELCALEEAICSANHHMLKNGYFQFPEKAYNV
ncbi:hypothetical protein LSTR_LSTR005240 [Laodelphax striatellus]|uniref:Uncharacterized protein n=1 Tax=Laodelphax striatellus TaxID=195883 RepID=A0A482XCE8_LAOST|nr:hypothetical protein LSTR_LSTR005240 [Laodelphax striatellus]